MRSVGLKVLKNKLSEYVRLAEAGETVLVTDRDRVVAELRPPTVDHRDWLSDPVIARMVREGSITLPTASGPPPACDDLGGARRGDRPGPRRSLIYLDSSVALALLFDEERLPPSSLWAERLVSSRLLEYEVWTRLNAAEADDVRRGAAKALIERIGLIAMVPAHLERALQPFPVAVRTLDALHLATMDSLRRNQESLALAS